MGSHASDTAVTPSAPLTGINKHINDDLPSILSMPTSRHYEGDVSGLSADESIDLTSVTPKFDNCRCIYADTVGIAKIQYFDDGLGQYVTEVLIVGPEPLLIRNVTKIYHSYDGGNSAVTSKIYTSAGSLVIGIKLRR